MQPAHDQEGLLQLPPFLGSRRFLCSDTVKALWVLFVFSYSASLQAFLWLVPGTISVTLTTVFTSFGSDSVQDLFQISAVSFLCSAVLTAYAMGPRLGLRGSIYLNAAMLTLVVILRYCAQNTGTSLSLFLWQGSAILTGLAGPIPSEKIAEPSAHPSTHLLSPARLYVSPHSGITFAPR